MTTYNGNKMNWFTKEAQSKEEHSQKEGFGRTRI